MMNDLIAENTWLRAALEESQRRERAAVEDLWLLCDINGGGLFGGATVCDVCLHNGDTCDKCRAEHPPADKYLWQWRGPKEAGEGGR